MQSRTDVNETEPCDNINGSLLITGFVEDNGTGSLTLTFTNCREGSETLDGSVTVQINAFDFGFLIPTDAIYSFSVLSLTSPAINVSIDGSIHSQISLGSNSERLTIARIVSRNNVTGEMIMITNQVSEVDYDNILFPLSLSESIAGRIFDSTHGYVDFTTIVNIVFSSITQEYPDSGQLLVSGSLNAAIRVTVISGSRLVLNLDLDGDAIFEISVSLNWTEIEAQIDLSDSDGDGMHDSWETDNGLDPFDPSDSSLDADGDGFDNLSEYLAGSDPNDPGSVPPPEADLSIAISDSIDPAVGGIDLSYLLTISNLGPNSATNVSVVNTLPTGAGFVSATGGGWACNHVSGTVTCTRGSLVVGAAPTITIAVTAPDSTGSIANMASVFSSTSDFNLVNNSAVETTDVTAGTNRVVEITLSTNDIIYDPVSNKIYASVPGSAGIIGDSITPIDPVTEQPGASVFIGSEPGPLAISDDGLFLYAGLDGTGAIRRFDIPTQTSGPEFDLGSDPMQFYAEDIEVQPGGSSVIAVSLKYLGPSPRHAGVAIYDNGIKRTQATPGHTGSNVIEYSASPSTLYGYNNESTEFGFRRMAIDVSGVSVSDVTQSLVAGFGVNIEFDNGRIYSTNGQIVDPVGLTVAGTFGTNGLVEPDSGVGRVFFLGAASGTNRTLSAYHIDTFQFLGSMTISGVDGNAKNLIRWGSNGLAFNTDQNEVFIIQTSLIP